VSLSAELRHEITSLGLITLYFLVWISVMLLIKWLVLAEYNIAFNTFSVALLGALILAKVVLVLEKVPIERWVRNRSGLIHVLLRTGLYALGVLVVLLLEKAFEARHEHGGFVASLGQVIRHRDIHHVLATAITVTGALLVFNAMSVIRRHLGERSLLRLFMSTLPEQAEERSS
jgi:hypothetical protein